MKTIKLCELNPCAWNPNVMTREEKSRLMASIREHTGALADWSTSDGYRLACTITLNRNGSRIIGGHHRVEALRELGQRWIHTDDVTWVDLVPESAAEKALNISLNRRDAQGEMDQPSLDLLIREIRCSAPELHESLTLGDLEAEEEEPTRNRDTVPVPSETPISQPGEIYALGRHRLLCGDSTDPHALGRLLKSASCRTVDLVFTDPPYNMDYQSKRLGGIRGDATGDDEFRDLILGAGAQIRDRLRDGGAFYLCMGQQAYNLVAQQLRRLGLEHRLIIWAKPSPGLGSQDYRPSYELILYGHLGKKKNRVWNGGRGASDLWRVSPGCPVTALATESGTEIEFAAGDRAARVMLKHAGEMSGRIEWDDGTRCDIWAYGRDRGDAYVHPTQKPVELIERAIVNSTDDGMTVLDLFAGGGSTIMAAERTGRIGLGIELDPRWCDAIRQRYAHATAPDSTWQEVTCSI